LMERQCRCRCRIKSVIVQLLWVGAQLPTLYNTVEYLVPVISYLLGAAAPGIDVFF